MLRRGNPQLVGLENEIHCIRVKNDYIISEGGELKIDN